jgi:hypothetical protein
VNLSRYVNTTILYNSTSADVGGTGVALTLSTAGSSGTGAQTSTPGGYPWTSTAQNAAVSLANYEGVRFTAVVTSPSTLMGTATLQAYFAISSTSSSTTWVAIQGAYAQGYSSGAGSQGYGASTVTGGIQVDVYRPKLGTTYTAIGAIVQTPSCSGGVTLIADRYGFRNPAAPVASTGVYGLRTDAPTTGTGPYLSVNGAT